MRCGKGDYPTAIRITLEYYDKSYHYGLSKRPEGQVTYIKTETDDVAVNAALVMEAAEDLQVDINPSLRGGIHPPEYLVRTPHRLAIFTEQSSPFGYGSGIFSVTHPSALSRYV